MKQLKLIGLALMSVCTVGVAMATPSFALPDVSVTLTGATYPLSMGVTLLTAKGKLSNVVKETITGEGGSITGSLTALGSLGTGEVLFTHVKKGTESCFSEEGSSKDPEGEILTRGTVHLVYTSLAGSAQGLQLGALYLVSPVKIKCGTIEVSVKGDTISSVDTLAGTEATEYTSLGGILTGNGEGKPNINFFYNAGGTSVKAKLEANFGTGFKEAALEVEELVTITAREGKMFVVTSR
jgi:hypothetical protein